MKKSIDDDNNTNNVNKINDENKNENPSDNIYSIGHRSDDGFIGCGNVVYLTTYKLFISFITLIFL